MVSLERNRKRKKRDKNIHILDFRLEHPQDVRIARELPVEPEQLDKLPQTTQVNHSAKSVQKEEKNNTTTLSSKIHLKTSGRERWGAATISSEQV